jgi:hypothetical protein
MHFVVLKKIPFGQGVLKEKMLETTALKPVGNYMSQLS